MNKKLRREIREIDHEKERNELGLKRSSILESIRGK